VRHVQVGFLGPAVFLTQLGRVSSPLGAVACMMASQGLDSFSQSGLYSNHQVCTRCFCFFSEVCMPAFISLHSGTHDHAHGRMQYDAARLMG
jgi:hypothetical protein